MSLQQVHLRINDAAANQPTPVRLRITDANGTYYGPYGRLTEFATGVNQDVGGNVMIAGKKWCYIDGACEILLPPGQLRIEITKGLEYKPIDEWIELIPGKMSLRFTIERWCDLRKEGWYSGDTRVHFMTPDAALLEGQAEDVAVVNLLACETEITDQFGKIQKAIPNILAFSGQSFARQGGGCGVAVNTHNVHAQLGSLGLLHCHRTVYPLTFDADDWSLNDWCGQCHRKKGLIVWTDPQHETAEFLYGEPLANAILGNIDAFELSFFEDSPFDALVDYYKMLNAGLTLPLVGSSAKDNNAVALGSMRTFAFLNPEEQFSLAGWIEALRAGQTFVSNGPILNFTIDGHVPEMRMESNHPGRWRVHVDASSQGPFSQVELIWNGVVIAAGSATEGDEWRAVLDHEFAPKENGWLAARCRGETLIPSRPAPQRVFAHSSPVAFCVAGHADRIKNEVVQDLLGELDAVIAWADGKRMPRVKGVAEEARTALAKKLS